MCGFFIQIPLNKSNHFDKKKFIESSKLISHRGPDQKKYFFHKNINFSFYRLSIIDKNLRASQLMISFSGNLVIVFNGEIYNAKELKEKLREYKFKSKSDTEVLLNLYHKYGSDCLKYLKGMFSFVIYDKSKNSCFFARDRFGIKPLYFKKCKKQILICSEIKPILNFSKNNRFNKIAFKEFLIWQKMDHKNVTFFKDVNSLEKSHYGIIKKNNILFHKYWSIEDNDKKVKKDFEKKYLEFFESSIKNHLISDRKVGLLFSGGTDSTALAIMMKKNYSQSFTNYTYDFESNKIGDDDISKKISRELKIPHKSLLIKPKEVIDDFDQMCLRLESPFTSIRLFGHHKCLNEMKKDNVAVALEGQGGDEILGGYEYNSVNSILDKVKSKKDVFNQIHFLLNKNHTKFFDYLKTIKNQFGVLKDCTPFLNEEYFRKNFLKNVEKEMFIYSNSINHLQKSQLIDIDFVNLPRSLKYSDKLSMSCGVENRVPFLDEHLASFCFHLKNNLKIRHGIERYISKNALSKITNKNLFNKEKKVITDPQSHWLKSHMKDFVMDNLNSKDFKEYQVLNSKKFIKGFECFVREKNSSSFHIFMNLTTFLFYKNFKEKFNINF